jgi:hypothetical protein
MKLTLCLLLVFASTAAMAQREATDFPRAAADFLGQELRQMEVAVKSSDRAYFISATTRMTTFLESWGLNGDTTTLERFPMCTDAVSDFLIVGFCKISQPGTICDPETFFPKFERNLRSCRVAAGV